MKDQNKIYSELSDSFKTHTEWLLIYQNGKTFALQANEIEIEPNREKILFSFLDDRGFQTWRIKKFEAEDEKISLKLTRNFERDEAEIVLVPRAKAEEFIEAVELARLERANKLGALLVSEYKDIKLQRVELNEENGRFAQIFLEDKYQKPIAVLSDVSDSLSPELLLSSSIIWLSKLMNRKKNPIDEIWLLSERRKAKNLRKLHACLRDQWKNRIKIKEILKRASKQKKNSKEMSIISSKPFLMNNLWRYKPPQLKIEKDTEPSKISEQVIKLYPNKIDFLFSGNGETLRYLGLSFLRVRRNFGKEKAWFGINRNRRILNENLHEDFHEFFANIEKYRSFESPNKQHVFYQMAPEAWLESILRRNIKLLDANLILSPIYNQFRTSRDKIDLLALRKDGRLVLIELKVSQDREMIFQAVDYWRKIELQRRKGILSDAKLFGDLEIADKPAICYLVAPNLSFHHSFNYLAKTVSEEIEMF